MRGLTTALLLAIAWGIPLLASSQPVPQSLNAGNRFVAQSLQNLEQHASITAKLHYESRLHDQLLVGFGNYWQLGNLDKRLTRWEMNTQIADQTTSFVQVYNGTYLWTDRRLPSGRQIHRLDVAWLQRQLRNEHRGQTLDEINQLTNSFGGQGGLGQMLADLLRNFDFQPPQSTQLKGLAVHALIGEWRPRQLVRLWPDAARLGEEQPPKWPEQLPHHVLLLIRNNRIPCVCEHRRASEASLTTSRAGLLPSQDPLLRYEIFDLQFAMAIPEDKFQFNSGDVDWTDETARVLEQLTNKKELPPQSETATTSKPQRRR